MKSTLTFVLLIGLALATGRAQEKSKSEATAATESAQSAAVTASTNAPAPAAKWDAAPDTNLLAATEAGAVVMPPVPAFYTLPKTVDDIVDDTVARVLDLFDVDVGRVKRWGEDISRPGHAPR